MILVTGAGGQLGRDIIRLFPTQKLGKVKGFTRCEWDVTDLRRSQEIMYSQKPDVVIHCAAYTQVDDCEQNRSHAYAVHVTASRNLAILCKEVGARLIYISTDYVFDGNKKEGYVEKDIPRPINVYGKTKRLGERWVERVLTDFLIIRTSWLFGTCGNNFVRTISSKCKETSDLYVVNDQWGCPTYTGHLAQKMFTLIQKDIRGIIHVAAEGFCSWYEFACEIARCVKGKAHIHPISSEQLNRRAKRPTYSMLFSNRLKMEGEGNLPHWKEGLAAYFKEVDPLPAIEGVKWRKLVKHCDDRGTFMEVVRDDDNWLERFGQLSASMTYPGVIKAFHYHEHQDDIWYFPYGNVQVVLHDLREDSPTYRVTEVYYMGEENPSVLLIPKKVAHGYRVLGNQPAMIVYLTTKSYQKEKPDEFRIPYNDPKIGFDWETKFR